MGSFRVREQGNGASDVSKRCLAVEIAANVVMVSVWTFLACHKHYRRYFLEMSRPSGCKLSAAGYQDVPKF